MNNVLYLLLSKINTEKFGSFGKNSYFCIENYRCIREYV